jgi:nucleoside-diphosphate-sugar epimerase
MDRIIVTGSTGVIGRRAVRELIAAGHHVTGVTRSTTGRERLEGREATGWQPRVHAATEAWSRILG